MKNQSLLISVAALGALLAFQGCAQMGGGGGKAGPGSIAHVKHVTDGWKDTPGKVGLGIAMEEEARIAEQHAGFAAKKPGDLAWMKTHIRP